MPKTPSPATEHQHSCIHSVIFELHTLISLNPALVSRSFTQFTAWNGVGEALTKERKSFAAVAILGDMVEYSLTTGLVSATPESI